MNRYLNQTTLIAGIAIFSMFFGAGNCVFPLILGKTSGHNLPYAFAGLLITAVGGPLLGLTAALMFRGHCRRFFSEAGVILGAIFLTVSLGLLGPLAVLPRCVIVSYAALTELTTVIPRELFILAFCGFSYLCCIREKSLLNLLGCVLSPVLIVSLISIIAIALATGHPLQESAGTPGAAFIDGLYVGYGTLDLVAAIIFSSSIWALLATRLRDEKGNIDDNEITRTAIVAGAIGGSILGVMYVGLSWAAAMHAAVFDGVAHEALLPTLATSMLGTWFGGVANLAVTLACFTTVVSLTISITGILQKEVLGDRVSRNTILIVQTVITAVFANTSFGAIMNAIVPILEFCYPAMIVLTIYNILNKIYGFRTKALAF